MSYKNKKRDSTVNDHAQVRAASGSRFSILDTVDIDTSGNTDEGIEADTTTKASLPVDNEPRIVSLWKSLQKKINDKGFDEPQNKSQYSVAEPNVNFTSSAKGKSSHLMKDITNGMSTRNGDTPSKARRNGPGSRILKDSGPEAKSFSIFVPGLSLLPKATAPSTSLTNIAASFGHCPPEISSGSCFAGGGSSSGSSSTAQASSDFASATFDKVADIPMVVQSLNSSDDGASLYVLFSGREHYCFLSLELCSPPFYLFNGSHSILECSWSWW